MPTERELRNAGKMCKFPGCQTKKNLSVRGYCAAHKIDDDPYSYKEEFEKLNRKMDDMLSKMNVLTEENQMLKEENSSLKQENSIIKARVNVNFYKSDAQNQYGRKESFRVHEYPEPEKEDEDNSLEAVKNVANKLGITFNEDMIQRCHRVGRKRLRP